MRQILLTIAFMLILYRLFNRSHILEGLDTSVNADIDAIQNLSNIAATLLAGGITVPGNMKVTGNVDVSTNLNVTGDVSLSKDLKVAGKISKISSGSDVNLNNYSLYLRETGDNNHQIQFSGDVDGPLIKGFGGGKLSTAAADIAKWDNSGLSLVNGGVFMPTGPMVKDNKTLKGQGVYLGWNKSGGQGETNIINNRGSGPGGISFDQYNNDNTFLKELGRFDGDGRFYANALCIGGTCIGETELRVLMGYNYFQLMDQTSPGRCRDMGGNGHKDCGDYWARFFELSCNRL